MKCQKVHIERKYDLHHHFEIWEGEGFVWVYHALYLTQRLRHFRSLSIRQLHYKLRPLITNLKYDRKKRRNRKRKRQIKCMISGKQTVGNDEN